jgi:sulfur relay protein TusB/DsrH
VTGGPHPACGTLHLVPSAGAALGDCLAHCTAGDGILLLDAGVVCLAARDIDGLSPDGVALYCLTADLQARGLSDTAAAGPWQPVDDSHFPALLERYRHCVSWK